LFFDWCKAHELIEPRSAGVGHYLVVKNS